MYQSTHTHSAHKALLINDKGPKHGPLSGKTEGDVLTVEHFQSTAED